MKKLFIIFFLMIVGISAQAQDCACDEQVLGREHMFCEKGGESNRNAGEERTTVRAWRGAMKGSKSVLELAKQSWHSDRFL